MKKIIISLSVIILIIVAAGAGFYLGYDTGFQKATTPKNEVPADNGDGSSVIRKFTSETLNVEQPEIDQMVASPLTVTGEATGTWYFEASFPIEIVSPDGVRLGQSFVQAQDDWMTESLVPFEGEITFDSRGYTEGFLVFHRDNPSGLPEFDSSQQIPVKFAQ